MFCSMNWQLSLRSGGVAIFAATAMKWQYQCIRIVDFRNSGEQRLRYAYENMGYPMRFATHLLALPLLVAIGIKRGSVLCLRLDCNFSCCFASFPGRTTQIRPRTAFTIHLDVRYIVVLALCNHVMALAFCTSPGRSSFWTHTNQNSSLKAADWGMFRPTAERMGPAKAGETSRVGKIWSKCGANSECGKLRRVLLHRPQNVTSSEGGSRPALFSAAVDLEAAQKRFDSLVRDTDNTEWKYWKLKMKGQYIQT